MPVPVRPRGAQQEHQQAVVVAALRGHLVAVAVEHVLLGAVQRPLHRHALEVERRVSERRVPCGAEAVRSRAQLVGAGGGLAHGARRRFHAGRLAQRVDEGDLPRRRPAVVPQRASRRVAFENAGRGGGARQRGERGRGRGRLPRQPGRLDHRQELRVTARILGEQFPHPCRRAFEVEPACAVAGNGLPESEEKPVVRVCHFRKITYMVLNRKEKYRNQFKGRATSCLRREVAH